MPSTCEPLSESDKGSHVLGRRGKLEEGGFLLGRKSAIFVHQCLAVLQHTVSGQTLKIYFFGQYCRVLYHTGSKPVSRTHCSYLRHHHHDCSNQLCCQSKLACFRRSVAQKQVSVSISLSLRLGPTLTSVSDTETCFYLQYSIRNWSIQGHQIPPTTTYLPRLSSTAIVMAMTTGHQQWGGCAPPP